MIDPIIECVPNFSEGHDKKVIQQIAYAISETAGVNLLHIDIGEAANRTVYTFAGSPESVSQAAFNGAKKALECIDMRYHYGEHPRIGAMDVCPLVPVSGITLKEVVPYARKLAKRIGEDLNVPVYCYEAASFEKKRESLASCRSGEYEGLDEKLKNPLWKPDFGPDIFNPRYGASVVGARNFLIAYNVNLNTDSVEVASDIACAVRESGSIVKDKKTGETIRDKNGKVMRKPGTLKMVRAIGWYIKEYKCAQVSMNLRDFSVTSVHEAFEEVRKMAEMRGFKTNGSELIGLIPLQPMLKAGLYFLKNTGLSYDVSEKELVDTAVKSMGLDVLAPFDTQKRILEYRMRFYKI
ncbi:MAG: glutamate formimidoyltransferase [Prolixibacteraceae bacterium]|nr:glutamate formimidoyltransferase [Prolixibacteraceae bacterium]